MDGNIMQCHSDPLDEQYYSGLGASAAILKANYSLDSFMTRYRRVDWTDTRTWECNSRWVPFFLTLALWECTLYNCLMESLF